MNRIDARFNLLKSHGGRKALIPFITAGYPNPEATLPMMHALVAGGADIIELGVPFSDPVADGATTQRSSECALAAGLSLEKVLDTVSKFRQIIDNNVVVLLCFAYPI